MSSIFDVIVYIFDWLRTTEFVPIVFAGHSFTFTILEILLMPFYAALTIFVVKHVLDLANN